MESNIKMLSVREVQQILRLSKDTVYKLMNSKGFPRIRIGRKILIPELELEAWIKSHMETKTEVKES